jgi:hypothetical protein
MRLVLLMAALGGLVYSTQANANDLCGGVLMATRSPGTKDHKALVQKFGFYMIDGGLVMNGGSTCTSIHIECQKATYTCRTATAVTNASAGRAHVVGVFMSDDYKITEWTKDTISAELDPLGGGKSYLHIIINDEVPDKAELINITKSLVTNPGEWVTEVLNVDNDPALANPLHHTEP